MKKIVRKEHSKENPVDNSDIDFTKSDKLTDEEIEKRAKNDPGSLPFTDEELKHVKIKKRHQKKRVQHCFHFRRHSLCYISAIIRYATP